MESGGQHGGASVTYQISLPHYPNIPNLCKHAIAGHESRNLAVLLLGRRRVHVDEVVIARVVEGQHQPLHLHGVAGGGGDQVCEGGVVGVVLDDHGGCCRFQDGDEACGNVEE